ncbi:hypothetical protein ACFY2K_42635 [Kitasatospora sp. NPDC001309]|uniref:hypothetical protein n=1 Tax=Kitasatospora sp. NPDC001309 TaxID=3364013 RepID=UPI00369E5336
MKTQSVRRLKLAAPALASTLFSAVLTVTVVALWLGSVMPLPLAIIIGLGFDGIWLSALAYERRLAAQGDHDRRVTVLGWLFGLMATAVLVAHALTTTMPAAWLAVSWLPLAAKGLWWLHSLWEATEISPKARHEIGRILQDSRDNTAIARASLNARTRVERVRMESLSTAGATFARAQSKSARVLAGAWAELEQVDGEQEQARALTTMATPVPEWNLPVWTPVTAVRPESAAALSGGDGADVRLEKAKQQASEAETPAGLRPETVQLPLPADLVSALSAGTEHRVPEQPKAPSVASLVRSAVVEVGTDPKAVTDWVAARTTKEVRPDTVRREIRNSKSTLTTPSVPAFGFAANADRS